jgi:hypothetical protein
MLSARASFGHTYHALVLQQSCLLLRFKLHKYSIVKYTVLPTLGPDNLSLQCLTYK